jgi:hypothetical protein
MVASSFRFSLFIYIDCEVSSIKDDEYLCVHVCEREREREREREKERGVIAYATCLGLNFFYIF